MSAYKSPRPLSNPGVLAQAALHHLSFQGNEATGNLGVERDPFPEKHAIVTGMRSMTRQAATGALWLIIGALPSSHRPTGWADRSSSAPLIGVSCADAPGLDSASS